MPKSDVLTSHPRKSPPITRRHKRVLRKLLFLDQHPERAGPLAATLTKLVNFNKELVDTLKANGLVELSAQIAEGRLEWHVRLSRSGLDLARTLGAMKPINAVVKTRLLAGLPDERPEPGKSAFPSDSAGDGPSRA